jgi:hypothetical protein
MRRYTYPHTIENGHQDEALTVQEGRIGYQQPGQPERFAGPGETVAFKAGEPHRFWNAGDGDLRCTGYIEPADNIEYFLTELYASTKLNGGARPDPFDAAFLVNRYRSEFTMAAIRRWCSEWCSRCRWPSVGCSASTASTPTHPSPCAARPIRADDGNPIDGHAAGHRRLHVGTTATRQRRRGTK